MAPRISKPVVKAKPEQHTRNHNANPKFDIATESGRALVYQEVGPLERFHLMGVLGQEYCRNAFCLSQAMLVCGVREIDGDPVMFPDTFERFENLILRVTDEMMAAIGEAVAKGAPSASAPLSDEELDRAGE